MDQLVQEDAAATLAQKYAPIVYIRDQREPCDTRGSPYLPAPVDFVFDVDDIVLRQHENGRTTDVAQAVDASDLYGKDDTYFLDFPGNPKRPGCRYEQDYLARSGEYTPTAYAHIAYEEGRDGFALQYWLFYYFNHWNNTHEGDWEMIQLTFDGPTPADALTQEPTGVGYSQHGSGERSDWDDGKLTTEGDHPVAFVAAGANANQFEPNIILGRGDNGTGFGCDDARRPSRRVDLDVQLMREPTSASDEFAWLAFDGRWGERAPWEFNGPTGPNDKRAWTEPFSWQEELRPSSIIVPSGGTLHPGPNAVNLFCDAVWFLSTPFALLLQLPRIVLLAAAVGVAAGFAFLLTRTRYHPATDAPLRQCRRLGQVLTSSARLYRRSIALFIGIGALFVPVGIIEAAIQRLLFSTSIPQTITHYFSDHVAVEALLAVTMGGVASSFVFWFVYVASLAAVARIERRRENSPLADYRDVIHIFWSLAVPRLKALGIVLLLTVTIIGIPWAIRHATRWAFIEESILLDRVESRDALAASARAVDGRWWYTLLTLVFLGFLGYVAGPAVAVVLLFWTSLGVSVINIVSSLIFAAVTPFFAIAHALLYFSLIASRDSDGTSS